MQDSKRDAALVPVLDRAWGRGAARSAGSEWGLRAWVCIPVLPLASSGPPLGVGPALALRWLL